MDNPYTASFVFPLIMVMLALFVYAHKPERLQNRVFLATGGAAALVIMSIFGGYLFVDAPDTTTWCNRLTVVFTLFHVAIHLYFACVFPEVHIKRLLVTLCIICSPVLVLVLPILFTDLFVQQMVVHNEAGHLVMTRSAGPLYQRVYAPLVMGYMVLAAGMFFYQYRTATTGIARQQVLYTAFAIAVGGLVVAVSCIVLPFAGITRYYQVGPLVVAPLYVTAMAVNVVSLRAMDIDQLLSKLLLWGLSMGVIVLLVGFGVHEIMHHPHRYTVTGGTALLSGCFMAGFVYMVGVQPRIRMVLQHRSRTYAVIVDRFHSNILLLKTVDQLAKLICTTVDSTLEPENISIFLRGQKKGRFVLKKGVRYTGPAAIDIQQDRLGRIPLFETVLEKEQVDQNPRYERYRQTGMAYFRRFGCVVTVPIIYEGRIIGVMNLGPRSRGFYRRTEIDFLDRMMTGINVAFSNSMLLDRIENINTALSRFVPMQCLELMGRGEITDVRLGDSVQQEMTIVFCDLKDFTRISEQMTPEENFRFINALLRCISPVIRDHNGFIDKYMGDAVMALFPGRPRDGVNAAAGMLSALHEYNREARKTGRFTVEAGIGVHTGVLMLGTIGEMRRMDSTVISDAVNQAQRIERMTRVFDVPLIVSETVARRSGALDRQPVRHLGRVTVKGKQVPLSLYEWFGAEDMENRRKKEQTRQIFEEGVACYYHHDTARARACFQQVLASGLDDGACRLYLQGDARIVRA